MSAETSVVTVAEDITTVEAKVTLGTTPRPEAVLFDTLATWLSQQPHRMPIIGTSVHYRDGELVMVLLLGEPMLDQI